MLESLQLPAFAGRDSTATFIAMRSAMLDDHKDLREKTIGLNGFTDAIARLFCESCGIWVTTAQYIIFCIIFVFAKYVQTLTRVQCGSVPEGRQTTGPLAVPEALKYAGRVSRKPLGMQSGIGRLPNKGASDSFGENALIRIGKRRVTVGGGEMEPNAGHSKLKRQRQSMLTLVMETAEYTGRIAIEGGMSEAGQSSRTCPPQV